MAPSKCHDAYEGTSSRYQKVKRREAKVRNQEGKCAQKSNEHRLNPDRDIHGKEKQVRNKKRDEKRMCADEVDSLGQIGRPDEK
jgi:hypothetical protein